MKRLEGKVALIAGAGRGIGRAAAKHLAAEGAKVAVLSLTPANIAAVVADIEAAGGTAIGVVCDVSDANRIKTAVESVAAAFGGIDVLVNAAFDPSVALSSVNELTVEQLQRNFDMGPIAYLRIMQAAHPYLKSSGAGRVINLGSAAGSSVWSTTRPTAWPRKRFARSPVSPLVNGASTALPSTPSCRSLTRLAATGLLAKRFRS